MTVSEWQLEMHRLLEVIEREAGFSLRKMDRRLDEEFRQYYLKMCTLRLDQIFNAVLFERLDESKTQTSFTGSVTNNENGVTTNPNSFGISVNNVGPVNSSEMENGVDLKAEDNFDAWIEMVDSDDESDAKHFGMSAFNDLNEAQIGADASLWCNKNAISSATEYINTDFSIDCPVLNSNAPTCIRDNENAHNTNQSHLVIANVDSSHPSCKNDFLGVKIENDIEIVDSDDEGNENSTGMQACNDSSKSQVELHSLAEPNICSPVADESNGEHINPDLNLDSNVEVIIKRECENESEIQMDDLPSVESDPKIINESSTRKKGHAQGPKSLKNKVQRKSSLNKPKKAKQNDDKRFKCNDCAYTGQNKALLQLHQRIHEAVKPFKCNQCDYATRQKINLKTHQRVHDRQKSMGIVQDPIDGLFKCSYCALRFTKWNSFRRHQIQSHKNNRRLFNCERCLQGFARKIVKDKHEMQCKKSYYECSLCKKYITGQKASMQEHMRSHSTARPFQCNICNKSYRQSSGLKYHMNSIHASAQN